MKEMQIDNLMIELGRQCNMKCIHCLRGEMENKDISLKYVYQLLNSVASINQIIFTGGEPLLYADKITKIIDFIIKNNIKCYGFYMATNGKIYDEKLMQKFNEFTIYVSKLFGISYSEFLDGEQYNCLIDVSIDKYHDTIPDDNLLLYSLCRYCNVRG